MRKHILIIILFVTLTYGNSLLNGFVGDDDYTIARNDFIKSWKSLPLLFSKKYMSNADRIIFGSYNSGDYGSGEITYRPVVTLSYMLDYSFWKLEPMGYHLTNFLLHCAVAILLYIFILGLAHNNLLAVWVSLMFACHPVNTEAVNGISFREELLIAFFLLSAFILFIQSKKYTGFRKSVLYISSCLLFFLGMLSKETAIIFPVLIILYDFLFEVNQDITKIIKNLKSQYGGYVISAIFYLFLYFFIFPPTLKFNRPYAGGTIYTHFLTTINILTRYVSAVFIPLNISIVPPFYTPLTKTILNGEALLSIIILLLLIILCLKTYKTAKLICFGIAWFFITILPVSNIITLVNMFTFRYMYLPLIGLCIVLVVLATKVINPTFIRKILPHSDSIIMIFIIGSYMAVTLPENIYWKNDFTFGQNILMCYPNTPEPYQALSKYYFENGRFDKSIEVLRRCLKYKPNDSLSYNDLGVCYINLGKPGQAVRELEKAVKLRPAFVGAHFNLGSAYLDNQEPLKAIDEFRKAVELDPSYADAYNSLAVAYIELKQYDQAKIALEKALQISPSFQLAKDNLKSVEEMAKE
jgi:hypothetical protein